MQSFPFIIRPESLQVAENILFLKTDTVLMIAGQDLL